MRKNRRAVLSNAIEALEGRVFLSSSALAAGSRGIAEPTFKIHHAAGVTADGSSSPFGGITPAQMQAAYGVNNIKFGSVAGNGAGQTIAIIDAYNDPTAAADLKAFDAQFGLAAPPSFTQLDQNGGTTLPPSDSPGGWGVEESLDIEWAHVIAPQANIILYEANSSDSTDLINVAANTAKNNPSVTAISMSFGIGEFSGETSLDSIFTSTHATFLASTGDNGSPGGYPAASPNVIGVGGTTLNLNSSGGYVSETGWSGSGGGPSLEEIEPTYQRSVQTSGVRQSPDISLDADLNTGVPVYDSYDEGASTPWAIVGGTSLASPMAAGLIAIANQGRVINGLSPLSTISNPSTTSTTDALALLYDSAKTNFHDITSGNNGGYSAGTGYDEVTGIGSPIANLLVPYLAGTRLAVISFTTSPNPVAAGSNVTLSAMVTDPDSAISSVTFYRESNGIAGLQTGTGGDTLVGTATTSSSGSWSVPSSTTGLSGTVTYFAVAKDASGVTGAAASATATVNVSQGTTVTLAQTSGANPSDATQSLTFTSTVSGAVPDGETMLLQDASNNNAVVASGSLSGGSATLTVPAGTLLAGTHNLVAVYGGDANFAAGSSATLAQSVQVVVMGVVVNGNLPSLAGAQRSMVNSIVYTFSEAVNVGANAFAIAVHAGQIGTAPTMTWTAINPSADGSSTQWVVTFSGAGVNGGSIADGVYDVTLNSLAATSDANSSANAQSRATDTFFRLYGDVTGDGRVSNADYNGFLSSYNLKAGESGYLAALDATGTGSKIGNSDYNLFLSNLNARVSGFTATI